ncbi:OmpA family protein [Vibrio navarrensis]|uniref:OmpA family protein n=1 Tax=Vibrio navarrensis TaxID=29495 RepID=A0AAI9CTX9_9VIBR|nr:OmpA family protein [Vibrio navarrensis]
MRTSLSLLCILLSGCSSLIAPPNMLDTAPKNEEALIYPDWGGEVKTQAEQPVTREVTPKRSETRESLQAFLQRNRIEYQLLPGNHMMIHLTEIIHFKTASAEVSADSTRWIGLLGDYLSSREDIDIVIDGHADSTGTSGFNNSLSERRAEEVKKQLLMSQVPEHRVYTRGYGEYLPACSNRSINGRKCNRRVELTLIFTR